MALIYAVAVPSKARKSLEYVVLVSALISLLLLGYLHVTFIRNPVSCLSTEVEKEWPRIDGVLRVSIKQSRSWDLHHHHHHDDDEETSTTEDLHRHLFMPESITEDDNHKDHQSSSSSSSFSWRNYSLSSMESSSSSKKKKNINNKDMTSQVVNLNLKSSSEYFYVIYEYSLEYGLLRLSSDSRARLGIRVFDVALDPEADACFGDSFSRVLLKYILGYDDVVMSSLKSLAEKEDNKGFVRNVLTGDQYRFVSLVMSRSSYFAAAFVMILFTICISMLLRYSHAQVFFFVAQLMQMLESNPAESSSSAFPFAPLLTVILALVGMEAVMSDFFNDTTTAFYVILIVWEADQFDCLCCHSSLSRKHWLKFFFLYHLFFYAYDYRFNGQYSSLALLSSWLLIQHSMLWFFHEYELPEILRLQNLLQTNVGQEEEEEEQRRRRQENGQEDATRQQQQHRPQEQEVIVE